MSRLDDGAGGDTAVGGQPSVDEGLRGRVADLPVAAGGFIGAAALLVPYLLVTLVIAAAADRGDPLRVAAGMFFTLVTVEPGRSLVQGFVAVTDVSALANVRPADYPPIETELGALLDLLQAAPEAAFLALYLAVPCVYYFAGRYLARRFAPGPSALDHVRAATTVLAGTVPVVVLLGLLWRPANLIGVVLVAGLFVPAGVASLGALPVVAYGDLDAWTSKTVAWGSVLVGLALTALLVPTGPLDLTVGQRAVFGVAGYLSSLSLSISGQSTPLFVVLVVVTIGTGAVRAYLSREAIAARRTGAWIGSSIALGTAGAVAILGILLPLSTVLIRLPVGATPPVTAVMPTVGEYLRLLLVGGVLVPLALGALGGYLTAWYLDGSVSQRR